MSDFLYPVALNVRGRRCVVVGGGTVGARKAEALAEAGAQVIIVAPEVYEAANALVGDGRVEFIPEPFAPTHLKDTFLVVVATDNADVNREVMRHANSLGILVNLAARQGDSDWPNDDASRTGDFATMATVRRGDLILALTTGGAGPALSARLRRELAEQFGAEWVAYVSLLAEMRQEAQAQIPKIEARTTVLRRLVANDDVLAHIRRGDIAAAEAEARRCLFV